MVITTQPEHTPESLYHNLRRAMRECALRWRRDGNRANGKYWLSRAKYWRDAAKQHKQSER